MIYNRGGTVANFCLRDTEIEKPYRNRYSVQGVSSHGKPGKVMEFHFIFPGLEKSWNFTPGHGKLMKVMEFWGGKFAITPLTKIELFHA